MEMYWKYVFMTVVLMVMLSACVSPKKILTFTKVSAATYKGAKQVIGKKMSEMNDSVQVETTVTEF